MIPSFDFADFINAAQTMQASMIQAANAVVLLAIKALLLLCIYRFIGALIPRTYRPLWGLFAFTFAVLRPDLASAVGDAALSILVRSQLLPQISLPNPFSLANL